MIVLLRKQHHQIHHTQNATPIITPTVIPMARPISKDVELRPISIDVELSGFPSATVPEMALGSLYVVLLGVV